MLHCFVIDDSDIIRKYSRLIFESLGFRVDEASDPATALERIKQEPPDYILVDWRVPGHNMHDYIAQLRGLQLQKRPYIIYVVTENEPADTQRALKCGADTFLLKPFTRENIEMKLQEIRAAA
jgi:two-component system chemotaxis response regulator CheY